MAFTAITAGVDWQSVSFVNEFIAGLNERFPLYPRLGSGRSDGTPIDLIGAGDDIQLATFWSTIQSRVEDQWNRIAGLSRSSVTSDTIVPSVWCYPHDEVDRSPSTPVGFLDMCSLNDSLSDSGWRAATTVPTDWTNLDDGAYEYRRMQVGDIIGPWIFVDLQNAIKAMKVKSVSVSPFTGSGFRRSASSGSKTEARTIYETMTPETTLIGTQEVYYQRVSPPTTYFYRRIQSKRGLRSDWSEENLAVGADGDDVLRVYSRVSASFLFDAQEDVDANSVALVAGDAANHWPAGILSSGTGYLGDTGNTNMNDDENRGYSTTLLHYLVTFNNFSSQ